MSGFVALFNLDGEPLNPSIDLPWLQTATAAMQFRGPDAQATWHDGPVGLGHALLRSTFEAAYEQQPCTLAGSDSPPAADGALWLVADARIDNRAALIETLRSHGHIPAEHKSERIVDPLLILHAYALWGEAALDHLIGDFAFVLWDGRTRRLFCARDQAGVVPLFYARLGNRLIISNTLEIVRSYPALPQHLETQAVADFLLSNYYLDSDSTIYAAIRRLPPAHSLTTSDQTLHIARYWQLPAQVEYIRYRQPQEYVDHYLHLFNSAVADRLRTSHVGSALSGGLDSTSAAVVAQRILQSRGGEFEVRGATVTYTGLIDEKEASFAQQVADFAGFTTNTYEAEEYLARVPPAELQHPDPEPWTITTLWPERTILQNTAQFARVHFVGFGGDPLLSWTSVPWLQALALGQAHSISRDIRRWLRAHRPGSRRPQNSVDHLLQAQWSLLNPALTEQLDFAARVARWHELHDGVDQRRSMFVTPLWETLFRLVDPGYTRLPLKVRFPFFDLRLVDYMMRVPPDPWCRQKTILRQAMIGLLPEAVLVRPKTPLGPFSLALWFAKHGIPAWVHEVAALPALAHYVDQDKLRALLQKGTELSSGQWQALLTLLTFADWLRQHKFQ